MTTRRTSQQIAVLGDGGWGTTLAIYLHQRGHRVMWWGAFPDYVKELARRRENVKFLPGIEIPADLPITADLSAALRPAQIVVVAVPSQYVRSVAQRMAKAAAVSGIIIVSAAKGLEERTHQRMTQVIQDELDSVTVAALSGPNIASEIAQDQPASSVIACARPAVAKTLQRVFSSERFRLYSSDDVIGVELGGALKNPLAIAAGISDGLGFGSNAKAALITRGVIEMARLGLAMGARAETFWGLSGLGDLITTCMAGRNHWLGEQLGQGQHLNELLAGTPMVIEGVRTAKVAVSLGRRLRIELPIFEQVAAVLFRRKSTREALRALMARQYKAEAFPV